MDAILGDGTAEENRGITSGPSPTKAGVDMRSTNRAVLFLTIATFFDNALYGINTHTTTHFMVTKTLTLKQ